MIELREVSFSFTGANQHVDLFSNLSLTVEEGEYVALVGESGGGKSTLLNLMAGFLMPTAGSVLVAGADLAQMNESEAAIYRTRVIGYVYQSFNLVSSFSALENVMTPLLIGGVSRKDARVRAQALLEQVGLGARARHLPHQLSGGEQQRVAIARALANKPRIIVADEPTGNLDPESALEVLALVETMHKAGITVVVATHSQVVAQRVTRVLNVGELRFGKPLGGV